MGKMTTKNEMDAGCWLALSSSPITATFPIPFPFEQGASNQEVYLSKQSVKESNSLRLLMIDSHHQH